MQRFNKWLALKVTEAVSSMYCAYLFAIIAFISLPAAIKTHQLIIIVAWIAQTFLQLVLLSIIMAGQKLQTDDTIKHVSKSINKNHEEHMSELAKIKAHLERKKKEPV